jgi:hypothetical protein
MTLDDTGKESNVRDSIKKYFVDSIYTTEGVQITFDKYLSTPNVQGKAVDRWVSVNFGEMEMGYLSSHMLNIFCCTRADGEGFKLAQLRDKVFKYLTDNSQTDGMARFAFYRSRADGAWTQLDGGFIVQDVIESQQFEAEDGTKYKILTARLRFSSKV